MKRISLPALVIHAGAGKFLASKTKEARAREALRRIVDEAYARLARRPALEVVIWAVAQMEDDPQFNAGTGAKLQSDGIARLTATLMDGEQHRFAGVVNIEEVKNPVLVAAELLKEKDRVLAGDGARAFARSRGFPKYNPVTEEAWSAWKRKLERRAQESAETFGTVGAVAVDRRGRTAAAASTGGKGMEYPGRVADTASIAGTYASKSAAVVASGVGEEIVELGLAHRIVTRVDDGRSLKDAFAETFKEVVRHGGRMGAIGVDDRGNVRVRTTTECILHAWRTPKERAGYP